MAVLNIGGADMPTPSSLGITYQDLDSDNSKRSESGILQRYRVRGNIHKLSCKWSAASASEAHIILTAISGASFLVKFYDPKDAADKTITAYVGDRPADGIATQIGTRWAISFDLIEY